MYQLQVIHFGGVIYHTPLKGSCILAQAYFYQVKRKISDWFVLDKFRENELYG